MTPACLLDITTAPLASAQPVAWWQSFAEQSDAGLQPGREVLRPLHKC